jgi:hypothetical protein
MDKRSCYLRHKENKILYQDSKITKILIESKYGNNECTINTKNYVKIKNHCWSAAYNKNIKRFSYVFTKIYSDNYRRVSLRLHNLIMDKINYRHKDKNIFNNLESNLIEYEFTENYKSKHIKHNDSDYSDIKITSNKFLSPRRGGNHI